MVHISEANTGVQYGSFNGIADYEQDLSALGFPDLLARFVANDFSGLHRECSSFEEHLKSYLERHLARLNELANADELQERLRTHPEDV